MQVILAIIMLILLCFSFVVVRGAPFVPSRKKYLQNAFDELLFPLSKNDVIVDIGSGGGIVLQEMVSCGFKKAIGYELNPLLVIFCKIRFFRNKKVDVFLRDFLLANLPDGITVFYCFGVEKFIPRAVKKVQDYSDRQNRKVYFLSLAFKNSSMESVKSNNLYHLYEINPCKKIKS